MRMKVLIVAALAAVALAWAPAQVGAVTVATPADLFGPLYAQVELRRLFPDSKTFADATPRQAPSDILAAYRRAGPLDDAALQRCVLANFRLPPTASDPSAETPPSGVREPLARHIAELWPRLSRPAVTPAPGDSALALPFPYVVPGGRFRELYYWDSYFTMLGLKADGRNDLVASTIEDFGSLIDRYGYIPNGTRTYYLSRSQPPLFYAMLALSPSGDPAVRVRRLGWLRAEHAFWMAGEQGLRPGEARAHVVALPDGSVLNRNFDARDTPREESYREDVETAAHAARPAAEVYADLRAGAESGWDYSSRWLADGRTLASIHTTDILPVDLNSLLYGLEQAIAQGCRAQGEAVCAEAFDRRARARAAAVQRYMWDEREGLYRDYDWRAGRRTPQVSAATLYPLFSGLASPASAARTARFAQAVLLAPGGLRTTPVRTGQQWDDPNGWAPLQWIAVAGLRRYGEDGLADAIACRWRRTVAAGYASSGRLVEKYDVETARPGGGGEYPLQDGFGWTNGVSRALASTDCTHASAR